MVHIFQRYSLPFISPIEQTFSHTTLILPHTSEGTTAMGTTSDGNPVGGLTYNGTLLTQSVYMEGFSNSTPPPPTPNLDAILRLYNYLYLVLLLSTNLRTNIPLPHITAGSHNNVLSHMFPYPKSSK